MLIHNTPSNVTHIQTDTPAHNPQEKPNRYYPTDKMLCLWDSATSKHRGGSWNGIRSGTRNQWRSQRRDVMCSERLAEY